MSLGGGGREVDAGEASGSRGFLKKITTQVKKQKKHVNTFINFGHESQPTECYHKVEEKIVPRTRGTVFQKWRLGFSQ